MSLANFFDKTALGAATVLSNFDREAFIRILEGQTVGIYFDETATESKEAKTILELSANLLARLFPRIAILSNESTSAEQERRYLINLVQAINPNITIEDRPDNVVKFIAVGQSVPPIEGENIFAGSDGWIVRISTECPVNCGESENPFGAATAACLAVANVFRTVFREQLPNGDLDKSLEISLIDFDPTANSILNPPLEKVDIGETCLVGVGAIGNGVVWALQRVPGLNGELHLIDHEKIELSNLQRYILTDQTQLAKPKVLVPAERWNSKLNVITHEQEWADYLTERADWRLDRVVAAVDSATARCAIQAALPRRILNGWTRSGNLGISRHSFLGDQACLMCLYVPEGKQKNEDELVADAIGLPDAVREVREMLYRNLPVGAQWIKRIAEAFQIDACALSEFENKSIREFYSEAVCGGIVLRLTGSRQSAIEAPMAFQSVLAGILLASELVIDAAGLRQKELPVMTQIDLLRPLGTFLSVPAKKDSRGLCICQDQDYISSYSTKYDQKRGA